VDSIRSQILALAEQHGVLSAHGSHELKAEAISRLADNDLPQDDASRCLVRLRRAGVLTPAQGHDWLLRLHEEETASQVPSE
jgi:hypothetical protein